MLIKTKLQMPSLRPDLLFRKKLVGTLRSASRSALVLISGPGGSGKTSLACQWIDQEKLCVAWYSLDKEDNTPDQFFRYLLTTLIRTDKKSLNTLEPLLADGRELTAAHVIPHLIEALSNLSQDIQLVLDDFHQITNSDIQNAMAHIMRYMPDCLKLVILSRHNLPTPLGAAIVKKECTEINAEALKFTETESVDLFRKVISNGFPVDQVRNLNRHVEGWAAGLQLIGLSISSKGHRFDISNILDQAHEQIANYLIHDILRMQPRNIRQFVFATALLDRFTPELCVEVTGMPNVLEILQHMERMNLFLIPLDKDRKWFRYHHMFSEVVRHQVTISDPGSIRATLCKAAKWLGQNNHLENALRCAFQSNDYEFAADLMEDYIRGYLETFELAAGLRWISKLPVSVLNQRPLLRLHQCGFLFGLMELSDVKEIISSLENNGNRDFSRYSGDRLAFCQDLVACFKYMLHIFYSGQTAEVEQFEDLQNKIGLHNPLLVGYIETHIVSVLISKGDLLLSDGFLYKLRELPVPRHDQFLRQKIYLAQNMAIIAKHRGQLRQSEQIIQQIQQFFNRQEHDHEPMTYFLHRHLGNIYYQQNRLDKARECASNASKYCGNFGLFDEIMTGNELWLQLHLAAGETEQADQCIRKIRGYAVKLGIPRLAASAELCAARFAIDLGNLAAAGLWSQRRNLQPDEPFCLLYAMECLTQARLLFTRGRYDQALRLLKTLRDRCTRRNLGELVLHIDIVQSATYHAMNNKNEAVSQLKKSLVFSEVEGYIRPFVNDFRMVSPVLKHIAMQSRKNSSSKHLENVLAACGMPLKSLMPSPGLDRVAMILLTKRETEILEWLALGFQNKEIAQKAFIAVTTVKSHVSNIMVKLNVKTRTQAILKAKEMNIL